MDLAWGSKMTRASDPTYIGVGTQTRAHSKSHSGDDCGDAEGRGSPRDSNIQAASHPRI
jgi:hypothetical protein